MPLRPSRLSSGRRLGIAGAVLLGALTTGLTAAGAPAHTAAPAAHDDAPVQLPPEAGDAEEFPATDESSAESRLERKPGGEVEARSRYEADRVLTGSHRLTPAEAADLRARGVRQARALPVAGVPSSLPARRTVPNTWVQQGPTPTVQAGRTTGALQAVTGRVTALAFRHDGSLLLGAAQGGVWVYDSTMGTAGTWTPTTEQLSTQAVGALAVAPSNDSVVYLGTGEGDTSYDSYRGDGVFRSSDGGLHWTHVSSLFAGESVADLAVDPTNPDVVYAAVLEGPGGVHFVRTTATAGFGVWKSLDGGRTWSRVLGNGTPSVTDVVVDPSDADIVVASVPGDGIYVSTDAAHSWTYRMSGLPDANQYYTGRYSLGISHPASDATATLYTGFDSNPRAGGTGQTARVYKSTDLGLHWTDATGATSGADSVADYCTYQCYYDNEVLPDPQDPDRVYALGSYRYDAEGKTGSGGIWRSTDGGKTWLSLGQDLHPDFHALAFDPSNTSHIAVGNDGGVWQSTSGGGRTLPGQTLSATTWQNLNGQVDPITGQLTHSTGLSISQLVSVQAVPQVPGQLWGGTQDNGTQRASTVDDRWFDQSNGDGGYVQVDQSTVNPQSPTGYPAYVFGEMTFISPFRYDPAQVKTSLSQENITNDINVDDDEEFYAPLKLNQGNPDQLFLGTYRLYRTDNAETADAKDVHWSTVSSDLTSGCTGRAPNGARGCYISAIGLSQAGAGVYAGTDEGWIQVSPDATTSRAPHWSRVGASVLPPRPVNEIAVDRSDWRIAYAAFAGYDQGSPNQPGHLFATTDGGRTWRNATGNLPNVPVNSVVIDPSDRRTLYVGTDVGVFASSDAGTSWTALADGMPTVAVWQLDLDPSHATLAAGTHGRGAYALQTRGPLPALVVAERAKIGAVRPGGTIQYTFSVHNIGNQDASGVTVTAPVPAHTRVTKVGQGGRVASGKLQWRNLTVPAGQIRAVTFSVRVGSPLARSVKQIVVDGVAVGSGQGVGTTGSPYAVRVVH